MQWFSFYPDGWKTKKKKANVCILRVDEWLVNNRQWNHQKAGACIMPGAAVGSGPYQTMCRKKKVGHHSKGVKWPQEGCMHCLRHPFTYQCCSTKPHNDDWQQNSHDSYLTVSQGRGQEDKTQVHRLWEPSVPSPHCTWIISSNQYTKIRTLKAFTFFSITASENNKTYL